MNRDHVDPQCVQNSPVGEVLLPPFTAGETEALSVEAPCPKERRGGNVNPSRLLWTEQLEHRKQDSIIPLCLSSAGMGTLQSQWPSKKKGLQQ